MRPLSFRNLLLIAIAIVIVLLLGSTIFGLVSVNAMPDRSAEIQNHTLPALVVLERATTDVTAYHSLLAQYLSADPAELSRIEVEIAATAGRIDAVLARVAVRPTARDAGPGHELRRRVPEANLAPAEEHAQPDTAGAAAKTEITSVRLPTTPLDRLLCEAGHLRTCTVRAEQRVGEGLDAAQRTIAELERRVQAHARGMSDDHDRLATVSERLPEQLRRTRMLPVNTILAPLRLHLREIARAAGKQVTLDLDHGGAEADRQVLDRRRENLLRLLRNAVDH